MTQKGQDILCHLLLDNFRSKFPDLAKGQVFVHTSWRRIVENSWNRKKIAVTLHRQSEQTTSERQEKKQ